jgi:uncharacterized protein YqhQ
MKKSVQKIDFAVGGQALMEGVLMRSPHFNAISVRDPDGKIVEKKEQYVNLTARFHLLNLPLLRGVINMFEMLVIGTRALNFSSLVSLGESPREGGDNLSPKGWANLTVALSMVFGLGLAIFLFKFLPLWFTAWLSTLLPVLENNYLLYNLVDAVTKTLLFIGYLSLMNLSADLRRVFMYHGAEHKSIMTYEQGLPLTVENARRQTRFHPRCGTSFILLVFLLSILVFTLLPKNPDFLTNFSLRLLALPLVAGLSYEVLKASARRSDSTFFRLLAAPGLLMQRLTTREPDDSILEVGLNSLKLALQSEQQHQKDANVP